MSIKTGTRVSKYIARAGLASRRDAEKLIILGRISINDVTVLEPWERFKEGDIIKMDGEQVKAQVKNQLILFNKPRGCLSASKDQRGRKTIFDFFKTPYDHLMIIGRLDYNSEGLILLTNNGDLKRYLELPKNEFKRQYRVKINGVLEKGFIEEMESGVTVNGVRYRPMELDVQREDKTGSWLKIHITEGKNREIRRILSHYDIEVLRLIRLSFGPFALQNLQLGKIKNVNLLNYKTLIDAI